MTYQEGHETSGSVGIIEAIETLTSIADLEIEGPIAVAERHEIQLQDMPIIYRTVHWLHKKNAEKVMTVVRETFRTILHYLRRFYRSEYGKLVHHESVEGIKTIMVLVGEAAKKVDKYTRVFLGASTSSIKETKEFRELWGFYERKIAPIAVQESLTKWIREIPLSLLEEAAKEKGKKVPSEHIFIDLDTVKKDSEYELFFIRKENGTRFFNPRLLRNIKLVCNFEEYFQEGAKADSLKELKVFKDLLARQIAQNVVRQNWHAIDSFIKAARKVYNEEIVSLSYRAIVALMLSANQESGIKEPIKGSSDYLIDFQRFLRTLVTSQDFQRLLAYPPKNPDGIHAKVVDLVQQICGELYSGFHVPQNASLFINELLQKGMVEQPEEWEASMLSNRMAKDYDALLHIMNHYAHVPLLLVMEALQDFEITGYDPLYFQNMPSCVFDLFPKGKRIALLRMPSPTTQEYINKAQVSEEFKAFLRKEPEKKLLLFDFQDRTNLRESARVHVLEELQKKEEFAKSLCVISMTKDSDFYHQIGPYEELNQADIFIDHLLEHISSENAGYFYPERVKKVLFSGFSKKLAWAIHKLFFGEKNVLTRHARLDFIELFYTLIQLKIIEIVQPEMVSFSCKDAIDIAMPASCEIFLLLKLLNQRPVSEIEEDYLKVLLYYPSINCRGRVPFPDRFSRLNNMTKALETVVEEQGAKEFHAIVQRDLAPLYNPETLHAAITIPQPSL